MMSFYDKRDVYLFLEVSKTLSDGNQPIATDYKYPRVASDHKLEWDNVTKPL